MTQTKKPNIKSKCLSDKDISRIFWIFKTDYGTAWTALFDDEKSMEAMKARWSKKLSHLDRDQIIYGLENMGKEYQTFPPNLNEFKTLCENHGGYKAKTAAHQEWLGLPKPDKPVSELKTEKTAIEKMKEYLK